METGILDLTRESQAPWHNRNGAQKQKLPPAPSGGSSRGADLPDGNVENTQINRIKIAAALRRLRPRVVLLPYWQGRHPDHYTTSTLGYEACFVSGLSKLEIPGSADPPTAHTRFFMPRCMRMFAHPL